MEIAEINPGQFEELRGQYDDGLLTAQEFTYKAAEIGMLNFAVDWLIETGY